MHEYKLLIGVRSALVLYLNDYLNKGWKLHGPTFITGEKDGRKPELKYAQAITK